MHPTTGSGTSSIGVVIPARNAIGTITACLEAVIQAATEWRGSLAVVVVDNGSTDGTDELVSSRYGHRIALVRDPDRSVGALRNLGARRHRTDLLSFVDADCVICPEYFTIAARILESTGAAAVGAPYRLPAEPGRIERAWEAMHRPPAAGPADWLYAGNMVIRRADFERVGGFSESLPTGEDPELGARLIEAGYALHCDPALASVHLGNPKTLRAFFRQQWWHGLGTLGSARSAWRNRPLVMALLHGIATVGVAAAVVVGALRTPAEWVLALGVSQAAAPALTLLFRIRQSHRVEAPVLGALLYWLYYWARLAALASVVLGVPRPPRGR